MEIILRTHPAKLVWIYGGKSTLSSSAASVAATQMLAFIYLFNFIYIPPIWSVKTTLLCVVWCEALCWWAEWMCVSWLLIFIIISIVYLSLQTVNNVFSRTCKLSLVWYTEEKFAIGFSIVIAHTVPPRACGSESDKLSLWW